jgi:hypothetical protein
MAMVETLRAQVEAELFLGHEPSFEERLGFGGEAPVLPGCPSSRSREDRLDAP